MFVNSLGPGLPPLWSHFSCGDPLNLSATAPLSAFRHTTHVMTSADTRRSSATVNKPLAVRGGATPTAGAGVSALLALQSLQAQQQQQGSDLYLTGEGAGAVLLSSGVGMYPSVIRLPGTLPQSSPQPASSSGDSPEGSPLSLDTGSPQDRTRVKLPRPVVASKELKFGIDRILTENSDSVKAIPNSRDHTVEPADTRGSSPRGGAPPPREAPGPTLGSPCHCGTLPCPLVLPSLPYPGYTAQHHPHPPALHGYRPADFQAPPYSLLAGAEKMAGRHHPAGHPQPKRKRSWSRAVFSNLQRKGLEKRFEVQKYVTKPDRRQLAAMLGLTDAQVKVWFQNRRMKWRHQEEARRKKDGDDTAQSKDTSGSPTQEVGATCCDVTDELLADDSDIDVDDGFLMAAGSDVTAESDDGEMDDATGKTFAHEDVQAEYVSAKEKIANIDTAKLDRENTSIDGKLIAT